MPVCGRHYIWQSNLDRLLCGVPASAEDGWIANCSCNSSSLEPVRFKEILEVGYQPVAKCQIPHTETCPHLSNSSTSTSLLETQGFSHEWVPPGSAAPLKLVSTDASLTSLRTMWCHKQCTHKNGFCTQKWWPRSKKKSLAGHKWTSSPMLDLLLDGAGQSTGSVQWTMTALLSTVFTYASTTDSAHIAKYLAKVDFRE